MVKFKLWVSINKKFEIFIGLLPWMVLLVFATIPFLRVADQTGGTILACAIATVFFGLAPFISLRDQAALYRLLSLLIFSIGLMSLAMATFANGILSALAGPAGIVCFAISMVVWGYAILMHNIKKERIKSLVSAISFMLSLVALIISPVLIGLPVLNMLKELAH